MHFTSKVSVGLAVLGVYAVAVGKPAAAQNLVNNGSFETPGVTAPYQTVPTSTGPSNWTVSTGTIDFVGSYWKAQDGVQSVDLSGNSPGGISQSINGLSTGQNYLVSFWLASNPDGGLPAQSVNVSFGNTISQMFTFTKPLGVSKTNMGWQLYSFVTQSATPTSTLSFVSDARNGAFGPALDNVRVTAVTPEASGLMNMAGALLAPGLGMVALRQRARSKSRSLAA